MAKTTDMDRDRAETRRSDVRMSTPELRAWFMREVVPLEPILMQYLQHNWRNRSDIVDLRQEVYMRVFEAAKVQIPDRTRNFVLTTARNLLINRVLHEQVVPIEAVADVEALRVLLRDDQPHLVSARVMLLEPRLEVRDVAKAALHFFSSISA